MITIFDLAAGVLLEFAHRVWQLIGHSGKGRRVRGGVGTSENI